MLQDELLDESSILRDVSAATLGRRRRAAGMSQEELAGSAGLEQSYISLLERGMRTPGLDTLFRISRAFGIKPVTLFREIQKGFDAAMNRDEEGI